MVGLIKKQKEAILSINGPVLISAGPGTDKTFTLVNRIAYLIQEKKVDPESTFVATFTDKAAKELLTRISNELNARNIELDINEMYIGTFHSLCMRFLRENLEYSSMEKNFSFYNSKLAIATYDNRIIDGFLGSTSNDVDE